jgi:hypothetical protein
MTIIALGQTSSPALIPLNIHQCLKGLLCCAACGALGLSAQAQNLLVDPSAESQISTANPATGYAQGWAMFNGSTFSQTVAESGTWSIADIGAGGFSVPGAYQQFAATAGQQFTLSGYGLTTAALNNDTTFGQLQITYFSGPNGTGSNLGTVETSPGNALGSAQINYNSPVNTWIPLSVTATAPAGTESMQAFTITIDQSAAPVYFDNLSLTATAVPEPSSLALAGLGGLGFVSWLRRRNK